MKNNLSLAGSEIINESKSKINNYSIISSISPNKDQKVIIKSYKITDAQSPVSNNNSSKNKENSKEKKVLQTKKLNSLDLSKIKYNDGYILTDAANSNPGFGLWALKTPSRYNNQINSTKNENKSISYNSRTNRKSVNNLLNDKNNITNNSKTNINTNKITITTNNISNKNNDKSLSITFNSKNDDIRQKNKLLIENLKMKCDDLENKCTNLASNLHQRNDMCKNSVKLKEEYEKILIDNTKEIKLIKEKSSNISLENSKLNNIYKNIKNEIDRLLNVMKTDKENFQKIKEQFNNRLNEEENERSRLNQILQESKEKVKSLEKENMDNLKDNNNENQNYNIDILSINNNKAKKDIKKENLNNIILELELKICNMKKKIKKNKEENDKLKHIIRYKEEKNYKEKIKLLNLNNLLKFQKENQKNELDIVYRQNTLINELKRKVKSNNKLAKSVSLKRVKQ